MRLSPWITTAALTSLMLIAHSRAHAQAQAQTVVLSPSDSNWEIELTDYGYSDILLDKRPWLSGREYLSGEWAAAVGYTVQGNAATAPVWLEPNFIYPDWTTNSDFGVETSIYLLDPETKTQARSVIANNDLRIQIDYQMLNTTSGIAQGLQPASSGAGTHSTSDFYVLQQTYTITNIAGSDITGLDLYQFLHGLNSATATYDNRDYAGPMGAYHYDITEVGGAPLTYFIDDLEYYITDTLTLHADETPDGWEVGAYDHGFGKPAEGVHISIENATLDGTDSYAGNYVSGAMYWNLVDNALPLADDESVSFDVLLSVSSVQQVVPEPSTFVTLGIAAVGCALLAWRRRTAS